MSDIHMEMRAWRRHLRQSRTIQEPTPKIEMPYLGEFIGE